ncbi:hypothetical protein [Lysinibacillus fusiformis]|uniref:hypothetical protein n=1 Tax=Lysinibacillus fusiformis TaxID=28031 RepID=UPI001FB0F392|nr:hypothetical protein [Lysinibacillus fusiformis]
MSEAAPRTPPGKDAGGTEINPSPCKVAFSAVDIIFFQQHETPLHFSVREFFIVIEMNSQQDDYSRFFYDNIAFSFIMNMYSFC